MGDTNNLAKPRDRAAILGMLTERRYAKLGPRGWHDKLPHKEALGEDDQPSLFIPGPGKAAIANVPSSLWTDLRRAYAERLLRTRFRKSRDSGNIGTAPRSGQGRGLPQQGVPGANNWTPIGPATILKGLATKYPPVSGRALRLAIAPGGKPVYVATADGGVWRSDNGGVSWKSTMDGFDQDPTAFASTSTACGAIAIDLKDPNRVYVGTGEGDTFELLSGRLTTALPSYNGIGAIRSDDGGQNWNIEATASGSPSLAGSAFYALAVDPANRENVIGATTMGLYRREKDGGAYHWVLKQDGVYTSAIACGQGQGTATTLYAAKRGGPVSSSTDGGDTWAPVGTGFPTSSVRVTLGARPSDASVLYALIQWGGRGFGLLRLNEGSGPWIQVKSPLYPYLGNQADYNLALAVDPHDVNLVYVGGQSIGSFPWDAAIYRCAISSSGSSGSLTYTIHPTFIGSGVHSDVHALLHEPGDSFKLWACCDGGVWMTETPHADGSFVHRNAGLATLCGNYFSQDPVEPAVVILGLQDNGVARYTGEECWTSILWGDGSYPVINWQDPSQMLLTSNDTVYLAIDGAWNRGPPWLEYIESLNPGWTGMNPPLAGAPHGSGHASYVAYGAGTQLIISTDFGTTWTTVATVNSTIFAITFQSPTTLYVGTVLGDILRFDWRSPSWTPPKRLDDASLTVSGIVTDIEVDPADISGRSVYVSFGGLSGDMGLGGQPHVWHYDGTTWHPRSGSGATGLLDVEHNAIVVDPMNTSTVFVGTDIGVWRSVDAGGSWDPFEAGLPDSAVFDLQIHPTARLLRASTYGRGMFELKLDPPAQPDVQLYVRHTSLDDGRGFTAVTADGLPDPEYWPPRPVFHWLSRNIKVDVPTTTGYQTATSDIDFVVFNTIQDGSAQTATQDPSIGTVTNRVYVEVHNRGIVEVPWVQVTLLLANAGPPSLPPGYETQLQSGTTISNQDWKTVGIQTISNLNAIVPQIAAFQLPSTMLPPPANLPAQPNYCLLALVNSPEDEFTSTELNTNNLAMTDRKAALRSLHVVQFEAQAGMAGMWGRLNIYRHWGDEQEKELAIAAPSFMGRLLVLLPPDLKVERAIGLEQCERPSFVDKWAEQHTANLQGFMKHGHFDFQDCQQMLLDIRRVRQGHVFSVVTKQGLDGVLRGLALKWDTRYPFFLYFEPSDLAVDKPQHVDFIIRDVDGGRVQGGSTYKLTLVENMPSQAG